LDQKALVSITTQNVPPCLDGTEAVMLSWWYGRCYVIMLCWGRSFAMV